MMGGSKVALVTGGTRGIGLGIARFLAKEGWSLALNGVRSADAVEPVLAELRAASCEVMYIQADISKAADRERLADQVWSWRGGLDALVNNAGVAPLERADILDATEESFERLIRTNVAGPFFLTQLVARRMIEAPARKRRIVFVTSVSAEVASVNRGEYCMSKAALSMAARLWAARLGEHDIAVYEVRPGVIHSDMTAGVQERYDRLIAEGLMLQQRWGEPEDVGRAVAMLLRGDLAYSTGCVVPVDGGMTIGRL